MTLDERRGQFIYDAARAAAIAAQAPIVPVIFDEREEAFKAQFINVIIKQCGDKRTLSAEKLHENWMKAYYDMGWVYGEVYDREKRIHPDLVPYNALGKLERDKDVIFMALCDIARLYITE